MRFDTPIYFQRIKPGEYDTSTGDYREDITTSVLRYASVTDSSTQTMNLVYGEIKQGSLTLRLQNHYTAPFDNIKIGKKVYRVDSVRSLRARQVFIVSEVQ
jgi:hypothetical protein